MSKGRAGLAVVCLSGGLDSSTAMAVARSEGRTVRALTLDYGQRHRVEIEAARAVARSLGAEEHLVLELDLRRIGGSALTSEVDVPKDRDAGSIGEEVPITYVPARNAVILSIALSLAEATGAAEIFTGVSAVDYSGYPDCRPGFIEAFQRVSEAGTRCGSEGSPVRIRAPLIAMSKAQTIRLGDSLGVDYSLTLSCYDPDGEGRACGRCDSCALRRRGFEEAGVPDPTRYA